MYRDRTLLSYSVVVLAFSLFLMGGRTLDAQPANNDSTSPFVLAGLQGSGEGTNVAATAGPLDAQFLQIGGLVSNAVVWWSWTAPADAPGAVTFSTEGSEIDTVIGVIQDLQNGFVQLRSFNDDFGGRTSSSSSVLTEPGGLYLIFVGGLGPATGDIKINFEAHEPISADGFNGSEELTGREGEILRSNERSTTEFHVGEPFPLDLPPLTSTWYSWNAPDDEVHRAVFTTKGSSYDTVMAIYDISDGTISVDNLMGQDDDGPGDDSRVLFTTARNNPYLIQIIGFMGQQGRLNLKWEVGDAPANDHFVDAEAIEGESGKVTASNMFATAEDDEPDHELNNPAEASLWWKWTAPEDVAGIVEFTTEGTDINPVLSAYVGDDLVNLLRLDRDSDSAGVGNARIAFLSAPGVTFHIAVDGQFGDIGEFDLSWRFLPSASSDDFSEGELLTESCGHFERGFLQASSEPNEPDHGDSIWYRYEAPFDGQAFFNTFGSNIDTGISVYTGESLDALTPVASNDDTDETEKAASVLFDISGGQTYHIAVTAEAQDGLLSFTWGALSTCSPPIEAYGPSPEPALLDVNPSTTLSWNAGDRSAQAVEKAIYNEDDRLDLYQVEDPEVLELADSTVALIPWSNLIDQGDGTYQIESTSLAETYELCDGEAFADQPSPGICSGFLIASDLIATAGGCVDPNADCESLAIVFGFSMTDAKNTLVQIDASQVYSCQGVVDRKAEPGGEDWAVVKLDRTVPDHQPLRVRRDGEIERGDDLFMIGNPLGLPTKVVGGASVLLTPEEKTFVANLDSLIGNPGSPIFNAETHLVEGILVRGERSLVTEGTCFRVNECLSRNCFPSEILKVDLFSEYFAPHPEDSRYEIVVRNCITDEETRHETQDNFLKLDLEPETAYCWRVITHTECGTSEGPEWGFRTGEEVAGAKFLRGDCNADGNTQSVTDVVFLLEWSFLGSVQPQCTAACDVNADGDAGGVTDAIYLLSHNFLGDAPPPAPYPACGLSDVETDVTLGCEAPPACP